MAIDGVQRANDELREVWNTNAAFWDERMGEGNDFHLELVWPPTERLLGIEAGMRVLDVGCGNGLSSRRMAAAGASVLGVDIAEAMIERARAHESAHADRIEYRVLDVTDESAVAALGERTFDAAVANMVLMDVADIRPLFRSLVRLLKPGAPFVFSVMHPAFNGAGAVMTAEVEDIDGELRTTYSMKVRHYLDEGMTRGVAINGQPRPQPYFHRPLQSLLGAGFEAAFVVDALEERAFPAGKETVRGRLSWDNFPHIPPVLVVRMRAPSAD